MTARARQSAHARIILRRFDALDRALVRAGFPATSPWWREQIGRFYTSGRRQWVVRAGRRAGKSSTLCRLAYVEARWGTHAIPPGDTGFVMFISRDRDEAAQRLRTIDAIADAVGDQLEVRGDERRFADRRTGFRVFTATIAGVSGPTAILVIGDEVAKWRDADTGANPATEVIASARPTTATQPEARIVWSSSPLGTDDAHARMFDDGDTAFQITSHAATWAANPTVPEARTRELEPDPRVWRREYAAIPQAGALGAFDADAVERAFARTLGIVDREAQPVVVIDASSGRKDAWSWGVARWVRGASSDDATPRDRLVVELVDGIAGRFFEQVSAESVVARVAACGRSWGASTVHGDQREAFALRDAFRRHGLRFCEHPWTAASKPAAVERLRRWFAEGVIVLPDHDRLRRELLAFEERITASGQFTFGARGTGHDDYVALLLTAAMADEAHGIGRPHDPLRRAVGGFFTERFEDRPLWREGLGLGPQH